MLTVVRAGATFLAMVALLARPAGAQEVFSTRVAAGFTNPLFASAAPGSPSTLYVVQQGGQIRTLNTTNGAIGSTPFLDLTAISGTNLRSGGEQGLLGLAFHPNYQANGLFYVNYTTRNGDDPGGAIRVEEYRATNGTVDPSSRRTIIQFNHPTLTNHYGGWIGFNPMNGTTGPNSGQLYITVGDGGGANDPANNGQNTNVLLGKILRLDINSTSGGNNYAIPAGNMTGTGVLPELYSYGLRNPFRASFDRQTGNFYIGDVGQGTREEVDFIANGATGGQNFGWRLREGTIQTPGTVGGPRPPGNVDPIFDYDLGVGQSITGGYVYRGPNAELDGTYFFGDFVQSRVFSFRYDGVNVTQFQDRTAELQTAVGGGTIGNISSFAEDGFGNLYIIDYGGEVFRIHPVPEPATTGLVAAAGLACWLSYRRRRRALVIN
jgi:glucose/arabinose dehydrogenase